MKKIPFTITIEDCTSPTGYSDNTVCPFAQAAKRQLGLENVSVGFFTVNTGRNIGTITKPFSEEEYKRLIETKKPFITEFTYNERVQDEPAQVS